MSNSGMYGGAIVLNYTGAVVKNNIIYNNEVYQAVMGVSTFGGGGIWVLANFGTTPKIIENNTIVGNSSSGSGSSAAGKGGGILVWSTSIQAKNNIIWGNAQTTGEQIALIGSSSTFTYNLVEGGFTGTGNIDADPFFETTGFYLSDSSACIDAGDPDPIYNDPEGSPGMGMWPATGTVRNDMGAYGGPLSKVLGEFTISSVGVEESFYIPADIQLEQNYPNPFNPTTTIKYSIPSVISSGARNLVTLKVYNVLGKEMATLINEEKSAGNYSVSFDASYLSSGIYFYKLQAGTYVQTKKMVLMK